MSIDFEKTKLLLGDIIKIYAPTNAEIHDQDYMIEYIDNQPNIENVKSVIGMKKKIDIGKFTYHSIIDIIFKFI